MGSPVCISGLVPGLGMWHWSKEAKFLSLGSLWSNDGKSVCVEKLDSGLEGEKYSLEK